MSDYHGRTLELLGLESNHRPGEAPELQAWAETNGVKLSAAYVEWATLDQGLLHKYSNQDHFWLHRPRLETLETGTRGLVFNSENQNNFFKLCLLDHGDDPPVLFSFCHEPWSKYSDRFSDCVYAQIFDWQYQLEFGRGGGSDIVYSGLISLRTQACVDVLRARYPEVATTWFSIEGGTFAEHRFLPSSRERIVAMLQPDGKASVRAMAETFDLTGRLEGQLLEMLGDDVVAQPFHSPNSPSHLLQMLGRRIDDGWLTQVRYSCVTLPTAGAMQRLVACHRSLSLARRGNDMYFAGSEMEVGGPDWGVLLRLKQTDSRGTWWVIQEIVEC